MATKHTTNYQLNLWEPEDKFLRTEFNENSGKIDAALKGHDGRMDTLANAIAEKSCYTKLCEFSIGYQNKGPLSFNISNIQWGQWFRVYGVFDLKGHGYAYVRFNNNTGNYSTGTSSQSGGFAFISTGDAKGYAVIQFTPVYSADRYVKAITIFPSYMTGEPQGYLQYSDVTTLDLVTSHTDYYFGTGGKITFYGEK